MNFLKTSSLVVLAALLVVSQAVPVLAADTPVGVVCNVKVVSDKVKDVSSLEAWKASYIKDDMKPQDKAIAVWTSVVAHQHQDAPPAEWLNPGKLGLVCDPIKMFNVYGYSFCSIAASELCELGKYAGLEARGWAITNHNVAELGWDGKWHLFDASLINYFPKADGEVASIDEVSKQIKDWLAEHPDLKGNGKKLQEFHFADKKQGWRKGPELLARCPWYTENGWWPAKTHGWYSTMQEYAGKIYDQQDPASLGYQVNIQLRQGEKLTRNWSNKGLTVDGKKPGCMTAEVGKEPLIHTPKFGDMGPGRVGNGLLEYDALADKNLKLSALAFDNLTADGGKIRVADGSKDGVLVIRMPTSYVYLTGEIAGKATVGDGGSITVSLSDNHGLDWKPVTKIEAAGDQKIDLTKLVLARYDYQVKFECKGAGTGFDALGFRHDIQHSQRALPALGEGANTITFSAGPQVSTQLYEGAISEANKDKQLCYTDFHPEISGMNKVLAGKNGMVTFPISTPGDLASIRAGCFYRGDYDLAMSFDGGKTYNPVGEPKKGVSGNTYNVTFKDIPAGTKQAFVRYLCKGGANPAINTLWISADYKPASAGFRPVKITYTWEEDGQEKTDVHKAAAANETYKITCGPKPKMKSIVMELAD